MSIVAIIDYGSGNLRSAAKAFERAVAEQATGQTVLVTSNPDQVLKAGRIVLPGVGAFADCMQGLEALPGMVEVLGDRVLRAKVPFLGICVGMQLLASLGHEHGQHAGLGWIEGEVERLTPSDPGLKIPHMGWNELEFEPGAHPLLEGLAPGAHAYFVHSYAFRPSHPSHLLASVGYGGAVSALIGRDNIAGTQFHPEKSQSSGLRLIANFLKWTP
ncbi:MAG: imidazole glycerol phosphate synthase subunit HisH [Alphaproteobacteria bacterium]|nr:imidazole glycerol phosphate synthase subunit HisH [Alphaproteobacteria bacterium]